jgi:hypothetical protein
LRIYEYDERELSADVHGLSVVDVERWLALEAALDMELVLWRDPDPGLRRALCEVFAPCEWVQRYTDYV